MKQPAVLIDQRQAHIYNRGKKKQQQHTLHQIGICCFFFLFSSSFLYLNLTQILRFSSYNSEIYIWIQSPKHKSISSQHGQQPYHINTHTRAAETEKKNKQKIEKKTTTILVLFRKK